MLGNFRVFQGFNKLIIWDYSPVDTALQVFFYGNIRSIIIIVVLDSVDIDMLLIPIGRVFYHDLFFKGLEIVKNKGSVIQKRFVVLGKHGANFFKVGPGNRKKSGI